MAKNKNRNYGNREKNITFNMIDEKTVARLERDGKIIVPKKKVDIPKDKRWNEKQMGSKLLQGIQNGDSVDKIAKSLMEVVDNNRVSAMRNARTMTTSAECHGRIDSYEELQSKGVIMKKVWIATPDDRTRESHLELDGEEADLDNAFPNGCQFPGDGNGPPEEVWNCRCSIRNHIIGVQREDGSINYIKNDRDETSHKHQIQEVKERENNAKRSGERKSK